MKVSVLTLGCRVNQSESAVIEGTLKQNGISIVNLKENPDYCIVNTCTVTARSDYNSRQLIRRAAKAGAKVIVTGCYSELRRDEACELPGVWKIVGNQNKLDVIDEIIGYKSPLHYGYYSRSRPSLKIQDGCNSSCSYCSVPLARGRSLSLPEGEVVKRVRDIEDAGYQEVVLTGIHLGSYGHDLATRATLKSLLKRLLTECSIARFRLSSLEISEIDSELIELISEERICNHLHLPLQSGSEGVLKLMNRPYSLKTFAETVEKIAAKIDNISIGSDVIVGFPGESEEDFASTLAYIGHLPLSYMHVFPFSPRPGTEAAAMKGRPDNSAIKRRLQLLAELNRAKKRDYMTRQLHRTLEIVVEEVEGEKYIGTSSNYLRIRVSLPGNAKGSLVPVRPIAIQDEILHAHLI